MLTIIEGLLDAAEVEQIRGHLDAASWDDGARTAGGAARAAKHNQQLADGAEPALSLGRHIRQRVESHPLFVSAALPRKILPPRFNRYADGGTYAAHVDSALMRFDDDSRIRTDLSATLFLSSPEEYEGGVLEIETNVGAQSIKLNPGDLVLYLANSLHRVTPVTAGVRLASFFWIESLVRDDGERALLFELDQSIQRLTPQVGTDNAELLRLTALYHNLLRRWTIT